MSAHIWANQAIWLAKESTRWTAASANIMWIPKASWVLNPNTEYMNDESGIWTIVTVRDSRKVKNWCTFDWEIVIWDISIWQLLLWVFWQDPDTNVDISDISWDVYDHDFELAENNTHTSYTIWANDNVIWAWNSERATYWVLSTFEINATAWDYVRATINLMWRWIEEVWHQATTFLSENKFSFDDVKIKVATAANKAAAITALNSAPEFKIQNVRINFWKNVMENQELWSIDIADIFNQNFTIEGDFTAVYRNKDIYDTFYDSQKKYMQLILKNNNVQIWDSSNPTLTILLNQVSFQTWSKSSDINAIITETIWFVGEFNTTDWEAVTASLKNTKTSY